jgi:hypothetical protein
MKNALLRRVARRCEIHDKASSARIRALETDLGMPLSPAAGDVVDQYANPDLIGCGHRWCPRAR